MKNNEMLQLNYWFDSKCFAGPIGHTQQLRWSTYDKQSLVSKQSIQRKWNSLNTVCKHFDPVQITNQLLQHNAGNSFRFFYFNSNARTSF